MSKFLSSILFSLFLLFQTTALAEEDTNATETNIEEPETQEDEASEETEPEEQEAQLEEAEEEDEPKEEISEAQKEAQAAEEAELREAGMGEEPLID